MPRELSNELLFSIASTSSQARPRTNEKPSKYLARITHLHLNGKSLTQSAISPGTCPALKTLYLFDNEKIDRLEGLGHLSELRHLYMQQCSICSVGSDLSGLTRLTKLYLNGNALPSIAPLAPLTGLIELHLNSQRLPEGEALEVRRDVLESMRGLRVLALANNGLTSADALAGCSSIETLDLAKNKLDSLGAVVPILNASPLKELDLRGNALSDSRQHLDAIIVSSPTREQRKQRKHQAPSTKHHHHHHHHHHHPAARFSNILLQPHVPPLGASCTAALLDLPYFFFLSSLCMRSQ